MNVYIIVALHVCVCFLGGISYQGVKGYNIYQSKSKLKVWLDHNLSISVQYDMWGQDRSGDPNKFFF